MNGNENERMMILTMVSEGKITAEDGARLLAALGGQPARPPSAQSSRPASPPRPAEKPAETPASGRQLWSGSSGSESAAELGGEPDNDLLPQELTTDASGRPRFLRVRVTDMRSGRAKVTVNLPMAMVRWGLRVGAHYAPEVNDFNMEELADLLEQGYQGKLVDVMDDEDGEHVEVFMD